MMADQYFPNPPLGYQVVTAPRNVLVAMSTSKDAVLYLDESVMQWRVLDVHVSEVAKDART